jgi:hypothetical protein
MNSQFIDIYCERLGPGFWAEPVNALTNIGFFIAAFLAWRLAKKQNVLHRGTIILIGLLVCIGAGSFLFHTLAVRWAMLADVIPILLFQIQFTALYCSHVMRLPSKRTIGILALFFAVVYGFSLAPETLLNGSLSYAPAFLFLGCFSLWHSRNAAHEPYGLLLAVALFVLSLTLRSLDMYVCPQIALGLHYMWHILNAALLYFVIRAYVFNVGPNGR